MAQDTAHDQRCSTYAGHVTLRQGTSCCAALRGCSFAAVRKEKGLRFSGAWVWGWEAGSIVARAARPSTLQLSSPPRLLKCC